MRLKQEKEIIGPPTVCVVCEMGLFGKIISRDYLGNVYAFCSEKCATIFMADPEKFIEEDEDSNSV